MKTIVAFTVALFFVTTVVPGAAAQSAPDFVRKNDICSAAQKDLRRTHQHELVMSLWLDHNGYVESFSTSFPRQIKLEKIKEADRAIRASHFAAARGEAAPMLVELSLDCSRFENSTVQASASAKDASQPAAGTALAKPGDGRNHP